MLCFIKTIRFFWSLLNTVKLISKLISIFIHSIVVFSWQQWSYNMETLTLFTLSMYFKICFFLCYTLILISFIRSLLLVKNVNRVFKMFNFFYIKLSWKSENDLTRLDAAFSNGLPFLYVWNNFKIWFLNQWLAHIGSNVLFQIYSEVQWELT